MLFEKAKARKTATSALGRLNNGYWEDLPRTKSLFLSLKSPKNWQKLTKKGQNGHFCPQKPLKWRFERQIKDKNLNFVLERAEKLAKVDQKRTKSPLLSLKATKMAVLEGKKGQKAHFCPREGRKNRSCNSSATSLKCNYLIMRIICFQAVPDEAKLMPSATLEISMMQIIN